MTLPSPGSRLPGVDRGTALRVRRPIPFHRQRGFRRLFIPSLVLVLIGLTLLFFERALLLPFEELVVVEGNVGSKKVLFDDEEFQRILLKKHLRVHVTPKGSRAGVTSDLDGVDFVFPSGQPAVDLLTRNRSDAKQHDALFTSPIVLGTYREYAKVLEEQGYIKPLSGQEGRTPIYYTLPFSSFVKLMRAGKKWSDLAPGMNNKNLILAQTSDLCDANHADTYLGLLAYNENGKAVTSSSEAVDVADRIAPMLLDRGMAAAALHELYFAPEGRQWPIIVMYEHQFLAHQVAFVQSKHALDEERVLLYPDPQFLTQPALVSLTPKGGKLGDALDSDTDLHRRALELGFRGTGPDDSEKRNHYLDEHHVPIPQTDDNGTRANLPDPALLERMIAEVLKGVRPCPSP